MNIPTVPMGSGQTVEGKVSWFGGPNDSTDSGHTALGLTTATPGIAVYNRATLGGYWRVTDTNTGRTAVLRQTDLGPAPFTGRKIDVTYSALNRFGYGEHNFPTDSTFKAEYLGHNPSTSTGTVAPATPTATVVPKVPGGPVVQLDQAAYQQAQRKALVGQLIASTDGGTKDNPLFASGLLSTKTPNPTEYEQRTNPTNTSKLPPLSPSSTPVGPAARAVAFGEAHIGKDAESIGQNLGPELNALEGAFGMKGEPWCAMFATSAVAAGGAPAAVRTASVAQIREWASTGTHGYMYGLLAPTKARPGDLLVFGDQHVALVKSVGPNGITTIEGNADRSGGVVELHHSFSEGQVARPNYNRAR